MAKPRRALNRLAPLLVVALAAALRLYNLNWKSADNDEGFSWWLASRPLPQLLTESMTAHGDPHPPVYWLTLKGWMALGGASEVSLRLLSALTGAVFVALVFYIGCRLFSRTAALAGEDWFILGGVTLTR